MNMLFSVLRCAEKYFEVRLILFRFRWPLVLILKVNKLLDVIKR